MNKTISKILVFAFIVIAGLSLTGEAYARSKKDPLGEIKAQIQEILVRLDVLESKTPTYYTKDFGPFTASKDIPSTVYYGCEDGDVSISGGMFNYGGAIKNWRTVRSYPGDSETNNSSWRTSIVNEVEDHTFNLRVKCLDL